MQPSSELLKKAADYLAAQDRELANLIAIEGACRFKIEKQSPYMALLRAIAGQQLHSAAAEAILGRLKILNGGVLPKASALAGLTVEQLRRCGFSLRKVTSLHALAQASLNGKVPTLEQAYELSDESLVEILTELPGIGRWTVGMLLIFTLGRLDVMPVDDFGIREGWRLCKALPEQPKPKALRLLTRSWMPYRSIGAWYLWRAVERNKPVRKQNPLTL